MESILRCEKCNKPFDKEATLKRHGYYCRTRRVGNISRSRSCIACAKGKARCDNRRPECSRCLAKAVECQYGATPPTKPALRAPPESIVVDGVRNSEHISDAELPDLNNHQEGGDDNFMLLNEPPIVADLDFTTTGADHFDWEAPDVDFSMLLSSPDITEQAEDALLPSNSLTYQPGPQGLSIGHNAKMQGIISSLNVSIFSNPSYAPAWSMVLRPNMQSGPQRIHSLIFHTLKSYPLMMPQHGSLPPFIHPSLMSSAEDDPNTEPLKNCISLVHMISRDRGSRKLFWKNVRMECERLAAEYTNLNRWGTLSAMSALIIYILIRLDEGQTEYNNYDYLILTAVTVLARQIVCKDPTCCIDPQYCHYHNNLSWKDWIYEESRRRLGVVYRVVNLLVYFEPGYACPLLSDLLLAPLPSRKALWEAGDEVVWRKEFERQSNPAFALAATGDLVVVDEGTRYCSDAVLSSESGKQTRRVGKWEEWCAGMDGFGALVLLAASLVA